MWLDKRKAQRGKWRTSDKLYLFWFY
ncbi:MAG: hypothetical protein ACLS9A_06590 [Clostridia bacterium]